MNGTPNCYDDEIASPGWGFFSSGTAIPDAKMGVAQLSNRILVPPDGLPFQGNPEGLILGYAWMVLPFTDAKGGAPPTAPRGRPDRLPRPAEAERQPPKPSPREVRPPGRH